MVSQVTIEKEPARIPGDTARPPDWDRYAKIAGVFSAVCSTIGLLAGGMFGLYTYHEQGRAQIESRNNEMLERRYVRLKDVYGQMVEAAAAVGSSLSRQEALERLRLFDTIYFGRAHIFVIDDAVTDAKVEFYWGAHEDVQTETFPSRKLQLRALTLGDVCRKALEAREKP